MGLELLLREGQINSMKLRNRIITGPMEKGMANRDGSLTQRYIDYLVERARGGASLIQVESTYVDTRGMGHLNQVGCHGDHVIPGLRSMAEAVHAEGAGRVHGGHAAGGRPLALGLRARRERSRSLVGEELVGIARHDDERMLVGVDAVTDRLVPLRR